MRICILGEFFYTDRLAGLSALVRHIKDHHAEVEVDVITTRHVYREKGRVLPPYEEWEGVRVFRLRSPEPNRESMSSRILAGLHLAAAAAWKLLWSRRYDVLLVVTTPPVLPLAAYLTRRWRQTPYVYLIHDLYPDLPVGLGVLSSRGLPARVSGTQQGRWLRTAARVVALGRCMKEHLQKTYHLPPEQVAVVTNWGEEGRIEELPTTASKFRQANDLQGFVVLYAGNIGLQQDFDTILRAAEILEQRQEAVQFCLVGEGAMKAELEERVARQGPHNVRFFPYVPAAELSDMLACADATLITLEPGMVGLSVPSKLYNILASGRPALAILGADSEVAQTLADGQCGLQVNYGAAEDLAAAIQQLAHDPQQQAEMGRRARQLFEERYTLPRVAEQYYELFREVVNRP